MKCKSVQNWLLQVDTLDVKDWPRNMNRHLKRCDVCAKIAHKLYKLEEAWRHQPVPASCEQAKAAFLDKLSTHEEAQGPAVREKPSKRAKRGKAKLPVKPAARSWHPYRWASVAAALFIGIITLGLLMPGQTRASDDLVERLVEWDLKLANTEDLTERKRILQDEEPEFKRELLIAPLSEEDHKLAEVLLDDAEKLAQTSDPVVEADIVVDIANKLLSRAESAVDHGNEKEIERCGKYYGRFYDHGYVHMKSRVEKLNLPERKGGFDKAGIDKGFKGSFEKGFDHSANQKRLEKIFQHGPESSRPDLHKRIEGLGKKEVSTGQQPHIGVPAPKGGKKNR